jgi:phytanoyl-CoA hydroxylase
MRQHQRTNTLGFSQGITDYPTASDRSDETAAAAEPGDLLVHHALTIHRADGNRSVGRPRRALGLVYYSENARENIQAHAAYQAKLAAELKASGQL